MRGPHNIWRLIRTGATFERTGAMKVALDAMNAPRSVRFIARVIGFPFRFLGYKGDISQPPVLRAISALGPAYVKFGQLMSTRADIVGVDLAAELSVLQDSMPAFDMEIARSTIETQLEDSIDNLFARLDKPIAAASLAQVHPATLHNGRKVAVKVLRPKIERAFLRDVDAFHLGAWLVEKMTSRSKRLRPRDVINHFEHIVRTELDLRMEASVGSEYAENTKDDKSFLTPAVIWTHSARRVLTTSWMDGEALTDHSAVERLGVDREKFAALILQSFLKQALHDGLFHADMHQGNLKIRQSGALVALDFGIMGRIDKYTRRIYAQILYGFLTRDYARVARVHFEAGYVPADQDREQFAQALRSVGEPIFGHDAENISMARLLGHLFEITEQFGMETRTELILLQRTMVVVEGVARMIDPDINIWEAARPIVEGYIKDALGPKAVMEDMREIALSLSNIGPELPEIIERLRKGTIPQQKTKTPNYAYIALGALLAAGILWLF